MKRSIGFALPILALWASMALAQSPTQHPPTTDWVDTDWTRLGLILPRDASPFKFAQQSGFVCVTDSAHNSARFDSAGDFVIDAVGHTEVSGKATVESVEPLVLFFHSVEGDTRISVDHGFAMISVVIAHGSMIIFGGQTVDCSPPPAAPVYAGNVDKIECQAFRGWAADMSRPSIPITVGVYYDDVLVDTVVARLHRQDVADWFQSWNFPDNGDHGFSIPLEPQFRNSAPHNIKIKFENTASEVSGSSQTIVCGPLSK